MADPQLTTLAAEILALGPADKLRLAADLLDNGQPDMAQKLANRVAVELGAAEAVARFERLGKGAANG